MDLQSPDASLPPSASPSAAPDASPVPAAEHAPTPATGSGASPASIVPGTEWRELPPAARTVFTLGGLIGGGVTGTLFGALAWAILSGMSGAPHPALVAGGLIAVFAATSAWRGWFRWHHTRWRLLESGIEVRVGRFWRSETLVPRSRVQHLDIDRGPIERRYGLATLTVHTAGTRTAALSQPGLLDADAVALRDALLPEANGNDDAL